jgi:hypothetical protein
VQLRLGAQGLFYPLTIFVKHPLNNLTAALELAPPDPLHLLLEAPLQLSRLLGLQALLLLE